MPYEVTQMRAYLNDYTKRIKDLLTTQEEIERYQAFTERLKNLADLTEMHYRSRIPFTAEHRAAFRRTYENALAAAGEVLGRQALGSVALQMRTVARELTPLLQMDLHAIELVEREPDLASRSLPELISRVRTQTADLGSQALPMGEESMPLKLQGPAGVETGMFTPVRLGEPNGQATAYSRLAGLLSQPELVNRTRPLLLNLEGGVSVLGSFSSRADGVDPDSVQPGDPLLRMQPENLDTPAAVSGLASMQLLDYLFGAARRGPENCSLRFNPPQGGQARLCGLTVRAEGVYMGSGSGDDARLAGLGAIPEALYLQLFGDEFEAKLRAALQDCRLPANAVERILARRDALVEKVQKDEAFFKDKPEGFVEPGRVRLVPENQWSAYKLENLAAANGRGYFARLRALPGTLRQRVQDAPAPAPVGFRIPVAKLTGNGLHQEPDPLNADRPETIKLHIDRLDQNSAMKGNQSCRYPVQWTENGKLRQGMFTLPQVFNNRAVMQRIVAPFLEDPANQAYQDVLLSLRDYYALENSGEDLPTLPDKAADLPWREMGLSEARYREILRNTRLNTIIHDIQINYLKQYTVMVDEFNNGANYGQRTELRNVAMSDVADELGFPALLARSTTAQVELDGQVVEGIFMERAEGTDFTKAEKGTALASIKAEKVPEVYNTEGLKDLADVQVLDYLCMNTDRHTGNMLYRFKDLETDSPKFLGVQCIDNDFSFLTTVPNENKKFGFLPALRDIRVISAAMAEALRKPELMDRIAAKMRKNGLNEAQIDAARQRLDKLKQKLEAGSLRVVPDGQWGKGENTVEKLAQGAQDTSLFQIFKQKMIDVMAEYAETDGRKPGNFVPIEEPKFQTVQRVESFGAAALRSGERKTLEQKAAERFADQAEAATRGNERAVNPEHQAILRLRDRLTEMKALLDRGSLPWPWGSGQYRRMHKACKALERFTKTLDSKLRNDPDAALSAEDREKLTRQLSELGDRSAAYSAYKRNDLLHNAPGTATEDRQAAAALCASEAARALGYVKEAAEKREKPMYMVQEALREAQAGLSGKDGRSLREQAARILCLNGLTRIGVSQKTGSGVRKALSEASMWNQMQKIMAEPAFQKLAELPDDELRTLAAGDRGRALGDQFIRELANRELAAAQQANGPQAAAPEQPQRGPEQQAQPGAEQQPQPGTEQQAQPGAEQPVQDGALIQ